MAQTYNPGDVACINAIIANNGLDCTPAPTDGSSVPDDWAEVVTWSTYPSNKRVYRLSVFRKSLTGKLDLTALTNLYYLTCDDNQLTALDVSKNTELIIIGCERNQLTELDITKNTELTMLSCSGNQLTTLDVSKNIKLNTISCAENQLTELDITKNTELTLLSCIGNQLTTLDVSKLIKITTIYCAENQLKELDVSKNEKLISLTCGPLLTALDVSNNLELQNLYCSGALASLDLSKNKKLSSLSCDNTQLTALDLSQNEELTMLFWYYTPLPALDVSKNKKLTTLYCQYTPLTALDVSNNEELTMLYCDYNQLTALDVSKNKKLTSLSGENNQLTELDLSNNTELTSLNVRVNKLTKLDLSNNTALIYVNITNNKLTQLDLSANSSITTFYGMNQEPDDLYMVLNDETGKYENTIALNNPTISASSITYSDGKLIADNTSFSYTPFSVETGFNGTEINPSSLLSGTFWMKYVTPPPRLYWRQDAANSNWYDPNNWSVSGTEYVNDEQMCPIYASTSVYIPGDAQRFPSLSPDDSPGNGQDEARCDSITFGYGAELAQSHRLHYNKAFVYYSTQYYNDDYSMAYSVGKSDPADLVGFASPGMERGEWYALAAPLKKIVTGDFSFGGFPYTWQQQFKSTRVSYGDENQVLAGGWFPTDPNLALEIGADLNYAICLFIPEYEADLLGVDDQKHLQNLKGAIKLPYFEDAFAAPEHPAHSYANGISKIHYFRAETGFPLIEDMYDEIVRGNEAYRFVFEDNSNVPEDKFIVKIPVNDNDGDNEIDEVMVGNPFMSSLDIAKLYEVNRDKMEQYYRIYHHGSFETNTTGATDLISVLQAFFVKPIGKVGTEVDLVFTKDMSIARAGDLRLQRTRSATKQPEGEASEDKLAMLKLTVANQSGSNYTSFVFNREPMKNVDWMFYSGNLAAMGTKPPGITYTGTWNQPAVPQVHSLDANRRTCAIQYIAANGLSRDVPIGIHVAGNAAGSYKLLFETGDNLNPKAIFVLDKLTGKKVSPVDLDDYEFTVEAGYDPAHLDDRFSLLIGKQIFIDDNDNEDSGGDDSQGIQEIAPDEVYVYADGQRLQVSSSGEAISEITVTALQGIRIASLTDIGQQSFTMQLQTMAPGIYIVRVQLKNGVTKVKKITY
jgi:hypothetical protein